MRRHFLNEGQICGAVSPRWSSDRDEDYESLLNCALDVGSKPEAARPVDFPDELLEARLVDGAFTVGEPR